MARKPKPQLWMELNIGGNAWRVYRSTADVVEQLQGADGVTIPDASLIVIDENLEESRQHTALVHEILHAVFSSPGIQVALAKMLGCSREDAHDREETIVSFLAPLLFDALKRNSLLRIPKARKR